MIEAFIEGMKVGIIADSELKLSGSVILRCVKRSPGQAATQKVDNPMRLGRVGW